MRLGIGKIAVAGVVVGASLLLGPASAGATHQPECPYPHKDGEEWTLGPYPLDSPLRRIDRNSNSLLCFESGDHGSVRDDEDPSAGRPNAAAEKVLLFPTTSFSCNGENTLGRFPVGFANIRSDANGPVAAEVSLKGAQPDTRYDFVLVQLPGGDCLPPTNTAIGSITTNGQGNGNAKLSATKRPGQTGAFLLAFGPQQILVSGNSVFGK